MKKWFSRSLSITLAVLTSVCLVASIGTPPTLVAANGIDLAAMTPDVDIKVNIGTTTLTESFLTDLKAALIALGVDADKIGISLTTSQTFNPADVSLWDRYDHIGDWDERASSIEDGYTDSNDDYHDYDSDLDHYYYPNMNPGNDNDMGNDPHIITSADGGTLYFYGYAEPAYNDFLLSKTESANDKQILFTIDEANTTYHSLVGSGFLFNAMVEDDLLSAYAVLVTEESIELIQIDSLDIDEFHDNWDDPITDLDGVTVLDTFAKPDVTVHDFEINIVGNSISIRDNGEYLETGATSPLDWDELSAYYDGLGLGKTLYTWEWDQKNSLIQLLGIKKSTGKALIADVDAAGGLGDYLILHGYSPDSWKSTTDEDGITYSYEVLERDNSNRYLVCDEGTVITSYDQAFAYLADKGYSEYEVSDYTYNGTTSWIKYYDTTYKNWTSYDLMVAKIAAYAADGIDISDYSDDWTEGSNFVWEYEDANGDYQEVSFSIKDLVPSFVSKSAEDYVLPKTLGYRFGPLVAYDNHDCEDLTAVTFSKLAMNLLTSNSSLAANAAAQTYGADSKKFFINLEDTVLTALDVPVLGELFMGQGASFIGVGAATGQAQEQSITTAAGSGMFVLKSDAGMVDKVAAYIYGIVKAKIIENLIVTYPVETTVSFGVNAVETQGLDSAVDILDDLLAGSTVRLKLNLTAYVTEDVPVVDKALIQDFMDDLSNPEGRGVFYIDVDLSKIVTNEGDPVETPVTETLKPIRISVVIPETMRGRFDYQMVRIHDGVLEVLQSTYDPTTFTLTFTTDKFSTYGVTFSDSENTPTPTEVPPTPTQVPPTPTQVPPTPTQVPPTPTGDTAPVSPPTGDTAPYSAAALLALVAVAALFLTRRNACTGK